MRAVLWCNAELSATALVDSLLDDAELFGVDGGALRAEAAGYPISGVLGDLDSVDAADWQGRSTLLPDDAASDLSKALSHLQTQGYSEVDVVGIDGGCPDHILGIWAALTEVRGGLGIRLHHAGGITFRVHPLDDTFEFIIPKGKEFSVFALTECDAVNISGAKWNLTAEPLSFSTRGLHNQSLGKPISISTDGVLAVIVHD